MDKVTHFEIPVKDPGRATHFYEHIFGWKINKMGEMPYWFLKTVETNENNMPKESGAINGGFVTEDDVKVPVIVISVDSIDKIEQSIKMHGGEIVMPKREIENMGSYARFKDSEGNIIGIWEDAK